MTLYQLANGDHDTLVRLLRSSYTIGQLQNLLKDLTSTCTMGMSDWERTARTKAIQEILCLSSPMENSTTIPQDEIVNEVSAKMKLDQATKLANGLVALLEECCDRIDIAGSIRRQKTEVKDIEILAQPKRFNKGGDLFNPGPLQIVPGFIRTVDRLLGTVLKGKPDGRYMQIELDCKLKLDLFMPQPDDYYRQFVIRTGSAEYSAQVIATTWKKKGWCGTPDGLRLIKECTETSSGWKCTVTNPTRPPAWQSEREFLDWLGVKYLEPKDRN